MIHKRVIENVLQKIATQANGYIMDLEDSDFSIEDYREIVYTLRDFTHELDLAIDAMIYEGAKNGN